MTSVKANFRDGDAFVIVETETNRVEANPVSSKKGPLFEEINLLYRLSPTSRWSILVGWAAEEWRIAENEAFEAVIGVIARVAAGEAIMPGEDNKPFR